MFWSGTSNRTKDAGLAGLLVVRLNCLVCRIFQTCSKMCVGWVGSVDSSLLCDTPATAAIRKRCSLRCHPREAEFSAQTERKTNRHGAFQDVGNVGVGLDYFLQIFKTSWKRFERSPNTDLGGVLLQPLDDTRMKQPTQVLLPFQFWPQSNEDLDLLNDRNPFCGQSLSRSAHLFCHIWNRTNRSSHLWSTLFFKNNMKTQLTKQNAYLIVLSRPSWIFSALDLAVEDCCSDWPTSEGLSELCDEYSFEFEGLCVSFSNSSLVPIPSPLVLICPPLYPGNIACAMPLKISYSIMVFGCQISKIIWLRCLPFQLACSLMSQKLHCHLPKDLHIALNVRITQEFH